MGVYRKTRSITASLIDYLTTELASAWSNVNVERTFSRVYKLSLPTVCVRMGNIAHKTAEIGATATTRSVSLLIDVFATSEGQREDLIDFLITKLKVGCIYYDYTIVDGVVSDKIANGRIRILNLAVTPLNYDQDRNNLDIHDRYRALISGEISTGQIEV